MSATIRSASLIPMAKTVMPQVVETAALRMGLSAGNHLAKALNRTREAKTGILIPAPARGDRLRADRRLLVVVLAVAVMVRFTATRTGSEILKIRHGRLAPGGATSA